MTIAGHAGGSSESPGNLPLGPLVVGMDGHELGGSSRDLLLHPAVGGVILFARNYRDPGQLSALCDQIRRLRTPRLLVCVDQEGGRVQRFQAGFTPLPPLATLGRWHASRSDRACDLAYRHGRVMAAEVLGHGVDLSLAPVLDLAGTSRVIGDRAMAADPAAVSELGAWYLAGMADAGMAACGKHFPGHGSVAPDSHHEVVRDERGLDQLERDLAPFRALAARLQAVMMAHVIYPAVDRVPAGYSRTWIGDVLRGELGFSGAVWSDDLDMAGAVTAGTTVERLEASLAAGCDLALVCRPQSAADVLARLEVSPSDASARIAALYGRPQFALDEQLRVEEFLAWRNSLKALVT